MKKLLISLTLAAFLTSGIVGVYKAEAQSTPQKPKTEKIQTEKDAKQVTNQQAPAAPQGTATPTTNDAIKTSTGVKGCPMQKSCEPKAGCCPKTKSCCPKDKTGCVSKNPGKK
ncbi:MAG: hypothetical protein NT175_14375 [Bacteroidetes bacterium]|nr:hypothetical protein [Bacteroidota bacterium]